MTSSERATLRSLCVPPSTAGRLVVSVRLDRVLDCARDRASPDTPAATWLKRPSGMRAISGWATQEPLLTVSGAASGAASGPANAAAGTVSGP